MATTRQASVGKSKIRARAVSLSLLLLWSCAGGPLSVLSPVTTALADNGGSGSGGGGGDHSGSGGGGSDHSGDGGGDSDGGGHDSDDGGGDNSGSRNDSDKKGAEAENAEKAEKRAMERYLDRLQNGEAIAYARITTSGVEVRYSDGWSESVSGGRYRLVDGRQRLVTERPARRSDIKRLSAAAAKQ